MNQNHGIYHNEISDHIEKYIGEINMVYHELKSDDLHIDIHHVPPQDNHPWHTYITSGMSEISMNVPSDSPIPKHAELILYVPEDKPICEEKNYVWPLGMLKSIARFPYYNNSYLAIGHMIEFGVDQKLFSSYTNFQGVLIYYPEPEKKNFTKLKIDNDVNIYFYVVLPLYREELDIDLKLGPEALLKKLTENHITFLFDNSRLNVGIKK